MPTETYHQLVDIELANEQALKNVDALIRRLNEAEQILQRIRTEAANVGTPGAGGNAGAASAAGTPTWYQRPPTWYQTDSPHWWLHAPPWFSQAAQGPIYPAPAPTAGVGAPVVVTTGGGPSPVQPLPPVFTPQAAPQTGFVMGAGTPQMPPYMLDVMRWLDSQTVARGLPSPSTGMLSLANLSGTSATGGGWSTGYVNIPSGATAGGIPPVFGANANAGGPPPFAGYGTPISAQQGQYWGNVGGGGPAWGSGFGWGGGAAQPPGGPGGYYGYANFGGAQGGMFGPTTWGGGSWAPNDLASRFDTSGLDPRYSLGMGLRYNIGQAQQEAQGFFGVAQAGQMMGNPDLIRYATENMNRLGKEVDLYNTALRNATNTGNLFNNQLVRHATWIVQGIALAAVFGGIAAAVATVVTEYGRLSDVTARLTGMGAVGNVRGGVLGQYAQAAAYGIGTQEAGQGAMTALRLNIGPAEQEQARQAAVIYGVKEYDNILNELYQTKKQLAAVNLEEFETMDTLATIYNRVTPSAEAAFDSIQAALNVYKQLGVAPELAAVTIARTAQTLETTPDIAGTTIQRLMRNVSMPVGEGALARYGISTEGGPGETIRRVIPEMIRLRAAATDSEESMKRFIDFMNDISSGTMQSASQAQRMALVLENLNELFTNADQPLDSFDKAMRATMDSATFKVNTLKASWEALLASMAATPQVGGTLTAITTTLEQLGAAARSTTGFQAIPAEDQARYTQEYYQMRGGQGKSFLDDIGEAIKTTYASDSPAKFAGGIPLFTSAISGVIANVMGAQEYARQRYEAEHPASGVSRPGLPAVAPLPGGPAGGPTITPFETVTMLPGGPAYLEKFNALYTQYLDMLKKAGFAAEQDMGKMEMLTDKFGHLITAQPQQYVQTAKGLALENLQWQQQVSLVEPLKNVGAAGFQDEVNRQRDKLLQIPDYASQREFNVRTWWYYDQSLGMFKQIYGTQEEINAASKQIQKNTSQIQGVFNVPEGGRVPWAAIMANYTDPSRLPAQSQPPADYLQGALGPLIQALSNWVPGIGYASQMSIPPMGPFQSGANRVQTGPLPTPSSMLQIPQPHMAQRAENMFLSPSQVEREHDELLRRQMDYQGRYPASSSGRASDSAKQSGVIIHQAPINIDNHISWSTPISVAVNIAGQEIMRYVQTKLFESTTMQRRVSSGGGGGGRSYITP